MNGFEIATLNKASIYILSKLRRAIINYYVGKGDSVFILEWKKLEIRNY